MDDSGDITGNDSPPTFHLFEEDSRDKIGMTGFELRLSGNIASSQMTSSRLTVNDVKKFSVPKSTLQGSAANAKSPEFRRTVSSSPIFGAMSTIKSPTISPTNSSASPRNNTAIFHVVEKSEDDHQAEKFRSGGKLPRMPTLFHPAASSTPTTSAAIATNHQFMAMSKRSPLTITRTSPLCQTPRVTLKPPRTTRLCNTYSKTQPDALKSCLSHSRRPRISTSAPSTPVRKTSLGGTPVPVTSSTKKRVAIKSPSVDEIHTISSELQTSEDSPDISKRNRNVTSSIRSTIPTPSPRKATPSKIVTPAKAKSPSQNGDFESKIDGDALDEDEGFCSTLLQDIRDIFSDIFKCNEELDLVSGVDTVDSFADEALLDLNRQIHEANQLCGSLALSLHFEIGTLLTINSSPEPLVIAWRGKEREFWTRDQFAKELDALKQKNQRNVESQFCN